MTARPTADEAQSDTLWRDLVDRNLPLVKYVLGKLSRNLPPSVDRDDLIAAGSLGLTEAARRYDASRKVPFHSYAIPRIWGAMLDELRSHDWLSSDAREQVKRLQAAIVALKEGGSRTPTTEEICASTGFSEERVGRLMRLARCDRGNVPEEQVAHVEESSLYARLGLAGPRNPYEETEFRDDKRILAQAIQGLSPNEQKVIVLRYHEELLLQEIGQVLGVSESRVCQIHTQALGRLRKLLARTGLGVA